MCIVLLLPSGAAMVMCYTADNELKNIRQKLPRISYAGTKRNEHEIYNAEQT
ncbi:MAG: hypothetical protein MI749_04010 [Desulfovibrionales bacterium]|nr:hypothetical protein [Desulfovibrionales bacterium]